MDETIVVAPGVRQSYKHATTTMSIKSLYPDLQLEKTDIFSFLFNRKDRPFPDSKVIFKDADKPTRQYTFSDLKAKAIDFGKGLESIY